MGAALNLIFLLMNLGFAVEEIPHLVKMFKRMGIMSNSGDIIKAMDRGFESSASSAAIQTNNQLQMEMAMNELRNRNKGDDLQATFLGMHPSLTREIARQSRRLQQQAVSGIQPSTINTSHPMAGRAFLGGLGA